MISPFSSLSSLSPSSFPSLSLSLPLGLYLHIIYSRAGSYCYIVGVKCPFKYLTLLLFKNILKNIYLGSRAWMTRSTLPSENCRIDIGSAMWICTEPKSSSSTLRAFSNACSAMNELIAKIASGKPSLQQKQEKYIIKYYTLNIGEYNVKFDINN